MPYDPNMRVLVVDDFATMRRIVKNILRQLGFNNVVEADDGTTAWEVLNKDKIEFIVSDWNMPKMTGIDLLRKVRASEEFGDLPFLMVTAEAQQENIIEAKPIVVRSNADETKSSGLPAGLAGVAMLAIILFRRMRRQSQLMNSRV